jgi:nitrogen regulatory protein P-II 1
MKLITTYVRTERGAQLMRALHDAGISGVSAYIVHGMSGETSTFLYSKRPFEPNRLPESLKLEVICDDESVEKIVQLIARKAKTGTPGDGILAIQAVEQVHRIRDL